MIYRMAVWTGIAAGLAGVLAVSYGRWLVATGLGLLALGCAVIVGSPRD